MLLNNKKKTIFIFLSILYSIFFILHYSLPSFSQEYYKELNNKIILTEKGASHLASLPLKCIGKEFPVKPMYVMSDSTYTFPRKMNPAFYGCFDWHSCVHGNWLLVALLKRFPRLPERQKILDKLNTHITADNIRTELSLFRGDNKSFERPYGWGWLLQLQLELLTWSEPEAKKLSANLAPLARHISGEYITYLKKLSYPVREPEHLNLALSLCFAWDYGKFMQDTALLSGIRNAAIRFFVKDKNCPVGYEPGGYDFLSPCLEEADIMQRVLPRTEFNKWLKQFMPDIYQDPASLFRIAEVSDPTDGKIVHLHGLNFSRAWCLNNLAHQMEGGAADKVRTLAAAHFKNSFPHVASGSYEGEHWLATFSYYALLSFR
jgi:hypothetical protein